MKKRVLLLSILISCLFLCGSFKSPSKPVSSIRASSYIVMNRDDYSILEGNDIHQIRSVASISKIMTCLIAVESDKLFDIVSAPPEATKQVGSSIYLKEGEKLSVLDLCYGLMLRSGNDAAYTIAKYIGNDNIDNFINQMNLKAIEIGMKNTTFTNPSGLDIDETGNLSTAYDMALLLSYSLKNEVFSSIVKCKSYSCQYAVSWANKNKLLYSYDKLDGGKTGYTYKAKRTLVTGASDKDFSLAICTLNCGSDFSTHKSLYEKYFNQYSYISFLNQGENHIFSYKVVSNRKVGLLIKKEEYEEGIKVYQFDESDNLKAMRYVTKSGKVIEVPYE